MLLKTILNRIQKHPGFVYGPIRLQQDGVELLLQVVIRPQAKGQPVCSGCQCRRPGYDTLPERRFEFVPMWGINVFFLYALRKTSNAKPRHLAFIWCPHRLAAQQHRTNKFR